MNTKLLWIFIFFGFVLRAQNAPSKEHYRIINPSFEFTLNYEKALINTQLDSLRFLNQRRQIQIAGTNIILELYSAQELLDKYGKPISPLTIINPITAKEVRLKLGTNNSSMVVSTN